MSATKDWLMDSAERDVDLLAAEIARLEDENAELRAALDAAHARTARAKRGASDAHGFGLMPGGRE